MKIVIATALYLVCATASAAPTPACIVKGSPATSANNYKVSLMNNCGMCVWMSWNVVVNGKLRLVPNRNEKIEEGQLIEHEWTMDEYGRWELVVYEVKPCA